MRKFVAVAGAIISTRCGIPLLKEQLFMTRSLVLSLFLSLLVPFAAQAQPATPEFKEGVHYIKLAEPVRPRDPKKIEVVELFQYGCPHCGKRRSRAMSTSHRSR
jgi:hypothetical protein